MADFEIVLIAPRPCDLSAFGLVNIKAYDELEPLVKKWMTNTADILR